MPRHNVAAQESEAGESCTPSAASNAGGQSLQEVLKDLQSAKPAMDVAYDVLCDYKLRALANMRLVRNIGIRGQNFSLA